MNAPVLVNKPDNATAVVTLNRPDKRNALTMAMMNSLCQQLELLADESARRIVILRGAGDVFCAGLDLVEAADRGLSEQSAQAVARTLQSVMESPLILIAAAHGAAYAGGAGLMCACDFVVAADDLRICFPEVRRGLVPALISAVIREQVGGADLRELLLLAEPIDARRARQLGLVHRVVTPQRLMDESQNVANLVLQGAPDAVRLTKQLLRGVRGARISDLLQQGLRLHRRSRGSGEAAEGIRAFQERRDPKW